MAPVAEQTNTAPQPRCLVDILRRMETGSTTKADAEFMHAALQRAGATIDALQQQVLAMTQRLTLRGRLQ